MDTIGMSPKVAAGALGISVRTLTRWRQLGAIGGSLTPGGRWHYSSEDVRRLLLAMRVEPTLGKPLS